jgi:hypothetical protein
MTEEKKKDNTDMFIPTTESADDSKGNSLVEKSK